MIISRWVIFTTAYKEAGLPGTKKILGLFESTTKTPIVVNQQKWNCKEKVLKHYKTLYGCGPVERSVYRGVRGGATLSLLDCRAGIFVSATTRLAKTLAREIARWNTSRLWNIIRLSALEWQKQYARLWSNNGYAAQAWGGNLLVQKFYWKQDL